MIYLVALPIGLLAFWLVYKTAGRIKRRRQAGDAAAATEAQPAEPQPADPALAWQLPVVAVDAWLAQGDSPAALMDAAREGKRPQLHPSLRDGALHPAFAAQVESVDPHALDDTLPDSARHWPGAHKRAMALAELLATRMLEQHFDTVRMPPDPGVPRSQANQPALQLEWLLPASWRDTDIELAGSWLATRLAEQGWEAPEIQVEARAVEASLSILKRLDDLNCEFNRGTLLVPHLLLATDSYIDEATLAQWDAARLLHRADNPEGRIPGEGAAAVLLTPKQHPAPRLPAHLGRLFAAQRAKAVDQPQRLQADTLAELAEKAGKAGNAPDAGELQLVADTDVRGSRGAEAAVLAETLAPEQDPGQSLLAIGVANGECGAALLLAAVAVAMHASVDAQQPCLVFSNQDPVLRAVLRVTPVTPPVDAAESTT